MATNKLKLTHIFRNNLRIIFWLILSFFIVLVILVQTSFVGKDETLKIKNEIAKNLKNPNAHLELANFYKITGNFEKARNEILISLNQQNGLNNNLIKEINFFEENVKNAALLITKWEGLLTKYPNYRDAYFRLSILYWQTFQEEKAKWALSKTLTIDPNYKPGLDFQKLFDEPHS